MQGCLIYFGDVFYVMSQGSRLSSQNLVEKSATSYWRPLFGKWSYLLERQISSIYYRPVCPRAHLTCAQRDTPCFYFLFPADLQCCQGGPLSSLPYSQQRLFRTFCVSQALEAAPPSSHLEENVEEVRRQHPCLAQQRPCTRSQLWAAFPHLGPLEWDSSPYPLGS